jgi:hypothetical protein
MKKNILTCFAALAAVFSASAQSPQAISYQAVVRNSSGTILANQNVGMRLKVLQGNLPGTAVYTETFSKTTSAQGLVNLEIGKGTSTDSLYKINWSQGPFYLEVAVDASGGTSYTVLGTSQFLSVPFALHAQSAENVVNDKVDDADADPSNEIQDLELNGDDLKITGNNAATTVSLSKYNKLTEKEVDSMVDNNGYAKALAGVEETNYNGTWSSGIGGGDSVIIATMPTHTTWHFDVVVTAHDGNSNTNFRNVHREFIVYRSWNLDPVLQNLVTHYDATTGVPIEVTFGTNTSQEVFYRVRQVGGGSTDIYYRVKVRMTKAN